MSYRLLACDIDDTLLRFPHPPSQAVVDAVQKAVQAGIAVVLVTGRAFRRAQPVAHALHIDTPIICNHGGSIRQSLTGECIRRYTLAEAQSREIVAWLQGQKVQILVFDGDRVYHDCTTEEVISDFSIYTQGKDSTFASDLLSVLPENTEIVLATSKSHEHLQEVYSLANGRFGQEIRVLFSHPLGVDMMPPSSKAEALAWLTRQMGISPSEVMAIGDGANDIDMLSWAGLGVAMEDGDPEAIAVADAIAPSFAREGVVWAIQSFLFS